MASNRISHTVTTLALAGLVLIGSGCTLLRRDPPEITITALDHSFDGPRQIEAGLLRIKLVNNGAEPHQAIILKIAAGKTYDDFLAALPQGEAAIFALTTPVGGPNAVDPGLTSQVVMELTAGDYALICLIPSADGETHLVKGMVRPLTVTKTNAAPASPPQTSAIIRLKDFVYDGPVAFAAGTQTIAVVNDGPQRHELTLLRLNEGATQEQVLAWIEKPADAPPFAFVGGATDLTPGKTNYVVADLQPGIYMMVCFIPIPETGAPHFTLGMVGTFTVHASGARPDASKLAAPPTSQLQAHPHEHSGASVGRHP